MANSEKRVALVIGNGAYVNAPPLRNPRNDAQGMSTMLTRLGFNVVSGLDLSVAAMEDTLGDFEETIAYASGALLFYAGHGLQVKGHNYLVPVDADIRQEIHLKRRAFNLDEILDIMVRRARTSLVFLDACRDNPFSRSLRAAMSEEEQKRFVIRAGLAEVKASQGSFIAFATAPDNVASDGKGTNSPFTGALLAHMGTPGQSVSDLMIEVRKDVLKATGGQQEPWDQSSLRERFCFVPVDAPATTPPHSEPEHTDGSGPIDSLTVEHTYWLAILHSHDPNAFEEYLLKFHEGTYKGPAKDRAEQWIRACNDAAILERLLRDYPRSERVPLTRDRLAELEWNRIRASRAPADFEVFLQRWPGSRFETTARTRLEVLRGRAERSGGGVPWNVAAGIGAAVVVLVAGYTLWPSPDTPPVRPTVLEKAQAARKAAEAETTRKAESKAAVQPPPGTTVLEKRPTPDDLQIPVQATKSTGGMGEYFVQVGARNVQEDAVKAFAVMQQKYAAVLGNYSPVVRKVDLGEKGIWYKLRVGPLETRDAADQLCNNLKSAGWKQCFSVKD